MRPFIHVTKEVRCKLRERFKVSKVMMWKALTYESTSPLADKIRKAAFENYGILMNELPCAETLHDCDGVIHQYFPNGAIIELDKNEDTGCVVFKGRTRRTYKNVMLSDIESIQQYAESLK